MADFAGRTLAGRYDVLELIGAGGMGEVYRARDRELDELIALKIIRADRADAGTIQRFRGKVKLARRVTHLTSRSRVRRISRRLTSTSAAC